MELPRSLRAAAVVAITLTIAACGGGQTSSPSTASPSAASPSAGAGGEPIAVSLQEWAVVPAADSAPAGDVTFQVTNTGPDDVHEFVIVRTDLDPGVLPTADDGSVDESGEGMAVVDEIEDIPVGETMDLTVTLDPGAYVLLCNIYDEAEQEAHYQLGMRTSFTVAS